MACAKSERDLSLPGRCWRLRHRERLNPSRRAIRAATRQSDPAPGATSASRPAMVRARLAFTVVITGAVACGALLLAALRSGDVALFNGTLSMPVGAYLRTSAGIGVMKLRRSCLTRPSTLPSSLPCPGRPKRASNRKWLLSPVKSSVGARSPAPVMRATAILVLSYGDRARRAAEDAKRADMAVEKGLRRLSRIGLHQAGVRIGKIHAGEMRRAPYAGDDDVRRAEIDLRMAGRMRRRRERVLQAPAALAHHLFDPIIAAGIAVLVTQPLPDALGSVALLGRSIRIGAQDRVDRAQKRRKLGLGPRRLRAIQAARKTPSTCPPSAGECRKVAPRRAGSRLRSSRNGAQSPKRPCPSSRRRLP